LSICPGLKNEFLRPKTLKKNFMQEVPREFQEVVKRKNCFHDLSGVQKYGVFRYNQKPFYLFITLFGDIVRKQTTAG
jgi:hypothetical protein